MGLDRRGAHPRSVFISEDWAGSGRDLGQLCCRVQRAKNRPRLLRGENVPAHNICKLLEAMWSFYSLKFVVSEIDMR